MIKIKRLNQGMIMPKRQTAGAAGYDLYAPQDVLIVPGRNLVKLGFAMEMPEGYVATIRPRSGFSVKGMTSANGVICNADTVLGTIDEDYVGEVGVIIKNYETFPFRIAKGTRLAQMIFQRYLAPELEEVEELSTTDRGAGGFGSTGVK